MKDKHLIVVSVDALVYEDLEYAKNLPCFGKVIESGSIIERVKTIYPSLTHPVHASLITGCTPEMTGIPSNELFGIGVDNKPWYNYLNQIKCDTIFHAAKRAGLVTAACRWPVTAGGMDVIDYLVPEFFSEYMDEYGEDPLEIYHKLGTCDEILDIVSDAIERYSSTTEHPFYDEFEIYCAAEIIRRYKPNLLLTHPGYVDCMRHRTGVFSDDVKEAICATDKWLSMLFDAVREAGIEDSTDFVILSDHGHLNICRSVCLNVILADKGYITVDKDGMITDWKAYVMSAGLSAHVYVNNTEDEKLLDEIYVLLKQMVVDKLYGFEKVFTRAQVKQEYGLDGGFSFVLETDGYSSFNQDHMRPFIRKNDITDYRYGQSTHGHLPEKGPQPPFLAMGPSFKRGVIIKEGNILNHAPTFAKILNISLLDTQGKVVDEILEI